MSKNKSDTLLAAQYDVIFDINDMGEYMLADAADSTVKPMFFYDSKEAYKELSKWLSVRQKNRVPAPPDEEDIIINELNELAYTVAIKKTLDGE